MKTLYGKYRTLSVSIFSVFLFITVGCKKLVEVPPPITTLPDEAAYSSDATAISILTGLYSSMSKGGSSGIWTGASSMHISTGLSGDELYLTGSANTAETYFFRNALVTSITTGGRSWGPLYNYIYRCNAAIKGISDSKTLSETVKKQLLGEAYFLRAFNYFYIVNLYGPVPIVTTTDYNENSILARSPVADVYKLIVEDLKQAKEKLSEQFFNGTINNTSTERVRPTRWAATAMLARVYLYMADYDNASLYASEVISNRSLFRLVSLNSVFLKNSTEAIWQIQPTVSFWNTEDAKALIVTATSGTIATSFYLNPSLLKSVEPGDKRFIHGNWMDTAIVNGITYPYAFKYKINTNNPTITPTTGTQNIAEYTMMLRLGELYLVRAEARAHQGNLTGAVADLDSIRQRAGLPLVSATNPGIGQQALKDAIFRERRVELFTEGCHRWFDLKRTGRIDAIMNVETQLKGGSWNNIEAIYPIPQAELQRAPKLEQAPGYPTTG